MTKRFYLILCTFLGAMAPIFGQATLGCDGSRYLLDVFPNVAMTNVTYGAANDNAGVPRTLTMDIYQPTGDVQAKRPVVVLAFGGGFVTGARADMGALATIFAKKGYVAVSIDYRLYNISAGLPDTFKIGAVTVQAMQDMKAAMRFLTKNAATYRLDTNNVIVGGISAGAITALMTAQLDSTDNIPTWIRTIVTQQGGFEGNSGNPGYSWKAKGVLNMSGALPTETLIDAGDAPMISYHGTVDGTVPYDCGTGLYGFRGCGSAAMYRRLTALRIPNVFISVPNGGHTDIYNPTGTFANSYAQFSAQLIVFCKRLVCGETIAVGSETLGNVSENLKIYPNPSAERMTIDLDTGGGAFSASVFDLQGRMVYRTRTEAGQALILEKTTVGRGIFLLQVQTSSKTITQKIVFE